MTRKTPKPPLPEGVAGAPRGGGRKPKEAAEGRRREAEIHEFNKVIHALPTYNDTELATISVALLESALRFALVGYFIKLTPKEEDELFDDPAPLSSFSGKIRVAYAMGIIPKEVHADLHLIRKMRNAFAHSVPLDKDEFNPSFQETHIVGRCHSLVLPDKATEIFGYFDGKWGWSMRYMTRELQKIYLCTKDGYSRWEITRDTTLTPLSRERFVWGVQTAWMFIVTAGYGVRELDWLQGAFMGVLGKESDKPI